MAYTYLIGWSEHKKYYYGVRFSKNSNPSELMVSYFTSSKLVKKYISKYGIPDVVQVRREFNEPYRARTWEQKVLKRLNVIASDKWLNKTDNISIDPISASQSWKSMSKEDRKNRSRKAGLKASENMTDEQKIARSKKGVEAHKKWRESLTQQEISNRASYAGKQSALKITEDQKKYRLGKLREVHNQTHICPHCGKQGKGTVMKKWHFNNCKQKRKEHE